MTDQAMLIKEAAFLRTRIRAKCLECSGGCKSEAKRCRDTGCPLWGVTNLQKPKKDKRKFVDGQQLWIKIEVQNGSPMVQAYMTDKEVDGDAAQGE